MHCSLLIMSGTGSWHLAEAILKAIFLSGNCYDDGTGGDEVGTRADT